jgi:glutaredoxin 2
LYKKDLLDTHQKICSLTQENFFKRNSEAPATTTLLKHAVDFMDRTSRDVQGELTQEKIDYHRQTFERKLKNIADLEQKLKENRSYIRHLETDISETEDLIMLLSAKINENEAQCDEIRKENSKIAPKGKKN